MESLVVEDQGDFAKVLSQEWAASAALQWMGKHQPFFTEEAAAAIHSGLEAMLAPKGEALADSADMPLTDGSKAVLEGAQKLREELRSDSTASAHIEPLHLLAAALAEESSEIARILKQAGVSREAVIAAIRSGESAE
jgi:ATP-dependent Clp protease ATP-binding subunit ClpA